MEKRKRRRRRRLLELERQAEEEKKRREGKRKERAQGRRIVTGYVDEGTMGRNEQRDGKRVNRKGKIGGR